MWHDPHVRILWQNPRGARGVGLLVYLGESPRIVLRDVIGYEGKIRVRQGRRGGYERAVDLGEDGEALVEDLWSSVWGRGEDD